MSYRITLHLDLNKRLSKGVSKPEGEPKEEPALRTAKTMLQSRLNGKSSQTKPLDSLVGYKKGQLRRSATEVVQIKLQIMKYYRFIGKEMQKQQAFKEFYAEREKEEKNIEEMIMKDQYDEGLLAVLKLLSDILELCRLKLPSDRERVEPISHKISSLNTDSELFPND